MNERFTLQLGLAAQLGDLADWLEAATVGERAVYATGFVLPREHESVKQVTIWAAAGLVHPFHQRDPDDARRWQWLIEKRSARPVAPAATNKAVRPDLTRVQMRCLLRFLARAAVRGEPCPTLAEMARHVMALSPKADVDRKKRDRVHYLLRQLEAEGAISRIKGNAKTKPVITILTGRGRGKSTRSSSGAVALERTRAQESRAGTRRRDR